ncbi:MAG: carbohydrate-binding family 9-like protein [Draconibacterium sp.]
MNELFIKRLKPAGKLTIAEADHLLEQKTVTHHVHKLNWKEFPYRPVVRFRIGHVNDQIWLKFYVQEKHILAQETRTNGDVYKDSCVEFFISFDKINYYNFEFSCIGTRHVGYGPGRANRTPVPTEKVEKIQIESSLGNQPFAEKTGNFEWEMMIRIPLESLAFSNITSLNETKATANFYKCGDETSQPHYVTWNPVETSGPDYHRPEFFGKVEFE